MKNPQKNEPAPLNPAAAGLKFRFVEKKHVFLVFFRHEVPREKEEVRIKKEETRKEVVSLFLRLRPGA